MKMTQKIANWFQARREAVRVYPNIELLRQADLEYMRRDQTLRRLERELRIYRVRKQPTKGGGTWNSISATQRHS